MQQHKTSTPAAAFRKVTLSAGFTDPGTRRLVRRTGFFILSIFLLPGSILQALEVASLHPLITDLAHKVGGEHVEVIELVGPEDDPHSFDPKPETLGQARNARLILASGKGLEGRYLGDLQDSLRPGQEIFEVGRKIPSLVPREENLASCCAHHLQGGVIDPHWWHDVQYMRRAARYLANEFARVDEKNEAAYRQNAQTYRTELEELDRWIRDQTSAIPRNRRILATSHLAFGYFCQAYGFQAVAIEGIHRQSSPQPQILAGIVEYLRAENVRTIFPDAGASPKVLQQMVADTGLALGPPLYADGIGLPAGVGYVGMMRHNVEAIRSGLDGSAN